MKHETFITKEKYQKQKQDTYLVILLTPTAGGTTVSTMAVGRKVIGMMTVGALLEMMTEAKGK